ncbi:glycoside hydrolase superfamily [Epithele typhae]|uniref:glycoside hydrolase superfamily n=1 Tax=Epithele typhae TaxID=378194 RepID=UPI0020080C35|nr:glycoside hydrolase superfamily [Epithele typhae]KAH9919188.1 glycoside hydrolase superfamily [Epithele typhae]
MAFGITSRAICSALLLFLCVAVVAGSTSFSHRANGASDIITWDNHTLILYGQRLFLHAGEFHTFRLPVPDLWLDIFQKMVAVGLNAASVYIHMGLSHPAPGTLDFDDWRSLRAMYEAAQLAGIFIILRPGPYINGETTSGGISHWITSAISGTVRTNASDWNAAYQPYIDGIIKESVGYQVTEGGPVIIVQVDNENRFWTEAPTQQYFAGLENQYRAGGIVVPLTYNDPGMHAGFINGTGAVDIYGLDAYPQGFNCSNPTHRNRVTETYHQWHEDVNPSQPWYMPEFQGGSFDPWADREVFYKNNWAANIKMMSYYMFFGGTSWGGIPFPGVYSSYDYGSAIRENRALTDKIDEIKRQGLFIRSSPQFLKTDWMGNSSTGIPGVTIHGTGIFVTSLRNPDSGTWFHIARHSDSTSTANTTFTLTVPTFNEHGVITDYTFGARGSVLYTTASIFFAGTIGARDVLFFYGSAGQTHELALTLDGIISPGDAGLVTLWDSATQLVLFADPVTAATFWAPPMRAPRTPAPAVPGFKNFFQFGTNATVLVGGPYLTTVALGNWRYADSLPEVGAGFDDAEWVVANKKTTNIFLKPQFGDGTVLYGCDYGLCVALDPALD